MSACAAVAMLSLTATAAMAAGTDQLQAFVAGVKSAKGEFTQRQVKGQGDSLKVAGTSSGTFAFSRPGKFTWRYIKPYDQLLQADGQTLYIYDSSSSEAPHDPSIPDPARLAPWCRRPCRCRAACRLREPDRRQQALRRGCLPARLRYGAAGSAGQSGFPRRHAGQRQRLRRAAAVGQQRRAGRAAAYRQRTRPRLAAASGWRPRPSVAGGQQERRRADLSWATAGRCHEGLGGASQHLNVAHS
ncbi:lipoprotein chaperone [Cupriavidus basilensis OR16]|uniref:Lipoprotein chaperone n=1 Tax=Cupriavidus basilensis OR16 TaxID=1127483 RepID=H1SF25_9BURK|nr:lipoprotein chaperone [Cupriavidus basilensis OR16]